MQQIEHLEGPEVNEDQLRQIIAAKVLETFMRGHEMQQESDTRQVGENSDKRTRLD
jgi:hypothetical protein